jgi:hypothetical protein
MFFLHLFGLDHFVKAHCAPFYLESASGGSTRCSGPDLERREFVLLSGSFRAR